VVELVIVADTCFQTKFKSDAKTTSDDIGFALQRIYWAQVALQVNRRYKGTYDSDPDLNLSVVAVGFVLLTVGSNFTNIFN
jgi:hypothetical protein